MTTPLPIDLMIESSGGGSARHVADLFEALTRRGHDTRLAVSLERCDATFRERLDAFDPARIIELRLKRSPHPSDLAAAREMIGHLKGRPRRILHAHSTKAGLIATLARPWSAATVFTPHAYRGMDRTLPRSKQRAIALAEHAISRAHDRVIAVSPEEQDYAARIGLDPRRVVFVPNGVDAAAIAAKADASPRAARTGPVLGFVGRLTYQKNPMTFLECFALVRAERADARAVVVGDGPMMDDVRAFIARNALQDAVDCLGHVDFVRHLHDIDMMVHTSHYESLPYVLLEACAVGLAIVAVRNSGTEVVLGETGRLVDSPVDARGLADRCLELLRSPDAVDAAGARSRAASARFSIEAMVDAIEDVYRQVVSGKPQAAQAA